MANITTFTQLNLAYNDPTQDGLAFSTDITQSYAIQETFGVGGFLSLGNNNSPIEYLNISPPSEFGDEYIGVYIKGTVHTSLQNDTIKAIVFEQIFCRDDNNTTVGFNYREITQPTGNSTISSPSNSILYNYTVSNNFIGYNPTTNSFECYLALATNVRKSVKGTYLLI